MNIGTEEEPIIVEPLPKEQPVKEKQPEPVPA